MFKAKAQKKYAASKKPYETFTSKWENTYNVVDIVKDVVVFIAVTVAVAGWAFLMLMIISFVTLSYLHFSIKGIILVSVAAGIVAAVWYIVRTVKKYRGMTFRIERRESREESK